MLKKTSPTISTKKFAKKVKTFLREFRRSFFIWHPVRDGTRLMCETCMKAHPMLKKLGRDEFKKLDETLSN